jgi:xanthine dehydrogenase accessory factor
VDSTDLQVLKATDAWLRDGHAAVLGTVVRTWGSSPRPVGSLVALRDAGLVVGSASGGCIEDDLVARFSGGAASAGPPQRLRYGATASEAARFGLPCGGTIELVVEPLSAGSRISELLARVVAGRQTRRTLDLIRGTVTLEDGDACDALAYDDARLVTAHGPRWRILLIGAGQLAHYVAQLALSCDYQVLVCDPRSEYAEGWAVPGTELLRTMPDDTVLELRPDRHTAVVALTHDPKLDDLALIEALQSDAFYVGAIGSQRTQAQRRERLVEFGVTAEQLQRLHGPVGLKNGARTPPEIAASIITEITASKYGYRIPAPERVASAVASGTVP